jgi:hypothetical protein
MDLGAPASYLTLGDGTAVFTSDGERFGDVEHVLADAGTDVFDGIVVRTGSGHRFVDAPEVGDIHERGVVLKLDARAAAELPEPTANAATMRAEPADAEPDDLGDKLRRAWHLISGKY